MKWLLDAVKHIKQQKQRPDRERICHYVQLHHEASPENVALLLDRAVKSGVMTTTVTRGNTDKLTYIVTNHKRDANSSVKSSLVTDSSDADLLDASSCDDRLVIHDKSDITSLMVDAVKGMAGDLSLLSVVLTCSVCRLCRTSRQLLVRC